MSQQIENQIVKMQFDNASFEKNAKESMSTLERLKQALHFDKVNMTPLQQAFSETENTAAKAGFHIRDIWLKVASTIEDQIANKIVNAGKKVFNALTLEGVSDGFKEYELKMGSIQTIMAGTGESLATVNKYLEDLNTYSDKTIYSFSDMTNSIGKFTNAGVKLGDAVDAIKGIANEAAVSGANSNEASRAMYNFAQALSAGYVKLIDWKSIENANMATKEFKQTLIDVAVGIGTVNKVGEDYQTVTTNAQGKVSDLFNSTKMFNDSLAHQWMTTDVLNKALKIYATDIRDANVNVEEYEKMLREELHLNEDQIVAFERMGMKAADAATEIKTFTMLIDTLKEAIGSGWAMTWQYFIGDFEQAKALWTEVGSSLGGMIDKMSEARNNLLKKGLQTGWEAFVNMEGMAIPESEKFRDILVDIAEEHGVLTKQQKVNIKSTNDLMDSFHELGWATGDLLKESVNEYTKTLSDLTDEERANLGITDEMMSDLNKMNKFVNDATRFNKDALDGMAAAMNNLGGRENIIQGLRNIFESFGNVLVPIKEAFHDVFAPLDPLKIKEITVRFREFTEHLKVSEDAAKTIKTAFTLAFGGIKTVINGVSTAIKGVSKLILPMLNLFDAVFGLAGKIISALTGSNGALEVADKFGKVGDKISNVYIWAMEKLAAFINKVADAIRGIPDLKIFSKIHDGVEKAITAVKDFWQAFVEMPVIQQMIEDFNNTVAKIEATITPIIDKVAASFDKLGKTVDSKMNMKTLNDVIAKVYNKVKQFVTLIGNFTTRIKTFFTNLKSGKSIVESFRESFGDIVDKVKELKEKLFGFFEDLFSKGDEMGKKFDLEKVQQAIRDFVHNITPEQITMIAVASSFMLIALNLMRLSEALRNAVDAFTGIGTALKNVINSYIKKQKSTILQVAEAIVIVAAALWVLSEVPEDKLTRAVGAIVTIGIVLSALTLVLTGAAAAIDKWGGKRSMTELATGLVLISGAFMVAALSLKVLEYVNLEGALGKVVMITLILTALTGLSILMSKIDKFNKGTLSIIALAGALFITASALAEISNISNDKIQSSMTILYEMMIGLSAVVFAASKVGVFSAVGLLAVVLMIDKLIPTLERMVNYDYTAIQEGLSKNELIIKKLGLLIMGMVGIGMIAGNRLKGAGIAILSIAASFAALLGVAKLASMMRPSDLDQGTKFLWSMMGMLAVLELCSSFSKLSVVTSKDSKTDGTKVFMKLAATMAILLGVAKLASMMEAKDLIKGGIAIAALSVLIGLMSAVAAKSEKSEGVIKNISVMLVGLSLILAEVALLSIIPLENMAPAFAAIISIMLAMAAIAMALGKSVRVIDKTQFKSVGILLPFIAAVIGVLAIGHLIREMAKENSDGVMKATGSIVAVMVAVAGLAKTLSTIKAGSITGSSVLAIIESVVMVAVIGAILAAIAYFMGTLKINGNKMQSAANAIATALLAMVPLLAIMGSPWLGGDGKKYRKMTRAVILAVGAAVFVGATLAAMSKFGNSDGIVKSAIGLAIGMIALCAPIAVIGMIGQFCQVNDPLSFVGIVAGAIVAAAFIGGIITKMSLTANPDSVLKTAQALSLAMLAMSVPIFVLGVVGAMCKETDPLTILAAVGGAVGALWAVSEILMVFAHGMDMTAIDVLNAALPALTIAMVGVIGAAAALAAIGMIPGSGFAALEPVLAAIAAFTLVIGAIAILGAALNEFEQFRTGLETGLDFLVLIAQKIGEAIGAFIGGIGVGISNNMPTIAKNLSDFSEELKPFAKNMAEISNKVAEGCKNMAVAILAIAGATVVESISRLLNLGLGNGGDLGFAQLGIGLRAFCEEIKDIPDDIIKKANTCSTIAKRLGDIASGLGVEGGVIGFFVGKKKDIGDFGKGISEFGKGIKTFCENVQGLPETALADAQNACDVSRPMVALTENLTNTEGLLQTIIGEKDLGKFGTNLADFATGLLEFVKGLVEIEKVDPNYGDLIQRCADGTTPIVNLASRVQNAGGKLADWLGDNTLDIFGETLVPFATELAKFVAVLNYIDTNFANWPTMISKAARVTGPLIDLANGIDNIGGVKTWFSGDNTLSKFGDTLVDFGLDLHGYAEVLSTVDFSRFDQAGKVAEDLIGLGSLASTLPKNAFKNLMDGLKDLGSATIWTIASEVALSTPDLVKSYADMCDAVLKALAARKSDDMEVFKEYGQGIVLSVKKGIEHDTSTIREALDGLIRTIKNYLEDSFKAESFKNYGRYLVEGLADGISENASLVTTAIDGVAEAGKKVIPETWSINSPSKMTYEFGKFFDLGTANGIKDYSSNVVDATEDMAMDVVNGANNIISQLARVIDSNVDTQPSIRPVLDTTGIENGAKKLNKIFDDNDLSLAYGISGGMRRTAATKANKLYSPNDVKTTANDASSSGAQINFTQNNYSPKALSRIDIYRQTKNQLSMLKTVTN